MTNFKSASEPVRNSDEIPMIEPEPVVEPDILPEPATHEISPDELEILPEAILGPPVENQAVDENDAYIVEAEETLVEQAPAVITDIHTIDDYDRFESGMEKIIPGYPTLFIQDGEAPLKSTKSTLVYVIYFSQDPSRKFVVKVLKGVPKNSGLHLRLEYMTRNATNELYKLVPDAVVRLQHMQHDENKNNMVYITDLGDSKDAEFLYRRGKLNVADRLKITRQIFKVLRKASTTDISHGDICARNTAVTIVRTGKGENDYVACADVAKMFDLDSAWWPIYFSVIDKANSAAARSIEHQFFGTPHYAAPERIIGYKSSERLEGLAKDVKEGRMSRAEYEAFLRSDDGQALFDSRDMIHGMNKSDVFSAGYLMAELLIGRPPYHGLLTNNAYENLLLVSDLRKRGVEGYTMSQLGEALKANGVNGMAAKSIKEAFFGATKRSVSDRLTADNVFNYVEDAINYLSR